MDVLWGWQNQRDAKASWLTACGASPASWTHHLCSQQENDPGHELRPCRFGSVYGGPVVQHPKALEHIQAVHTCCMPTHTHAHYTPSCVICPLLGLPPLHELEISGLIKCSPSRSKLAPRKPVNFAMCLKWESKHHCIKGNCSFWIQNCHKALMIFAMFCHVLQTFGLF